MSLLVELLDKSHLKSSFNCGQALLDNYIQKQAKQDVRRDLAACFVLTDHTEKLVLGYYTLSGNSIKRKELPDDLVKKLPPSYDDLPTVLLGRLAIDKAYQGRRLGEYLLTDALNRCADLSKTLGTLAVVVEPIDSNAARFYQGYGFIELTGSGKMFIPVKTIKDSRQI